MGGLLLFSDISPGCSRKLELDFKGKQVLSSESNETTKVLVWKVTCPQDNFQAFLLSMQACTLNHFSGVQLFATLWIVACQTPLFMGFSRQEYWSGWPFPSPRDLPNQGFEPGSPARQADSLPSEPPGKPSKLDIYNRRRKWQPTPVFLPGESHKQRSLVGYSPWSHKELDLTE